MKTNIYKLVLGVVIFLFAFNLNAQDYQYIPLVKPGLQIWTDDYRTGTFYYFNRFALTDEDTIIESENYKKLYWFKDPVFNPLTARCIGGLRETSQKRVYYKGNTDVEGTILSGLIFDFSLSVGDTFTNTRSLFYSMVFQIKSIDTIDFAGKRRREFKIGVASDTPYIVGRIIEGIGNTEGIMYEMSWNLMLGMDWGLNRCYEHGGELLYHNYSQGTEDCITPLVGLENISLNGNSITIYPNPTNSEVNISSENIINSIEIYNSLGQRVYYSVVNSMEKVIDISSFVNGVYILGVNTENGVIRKKIIKN